jgi:iron complex outermembrane receptor protein
MFMKIIHLIFLVLFSCYLSAQYTLSGKITNQSGEVLESAVIYLNDNSYMTASDPQGNFKIENIKGGEYKLSSTYLGYEKMSFDIVINKNTEFNIIMQGSVYNLDEIEIQASRTDDNSPFTKKNLTKAYIQKENLGQDVPYILQWTPSMVVSSDGGTGIGYTNLRLRGSDQTRIHVTFNGVPVNDAESHNVFWVDLPNLLGSTKDIQIQRGVGTSTNGIGAFGGTVSINTVNTSINPFVEADATIGSYHTKKISVGASTGIMNNKYIVEGRFSNIRSEGYVDRADANLNSFYLSLGKVSDKSSLRFNVMHGQERTYQAWYGTPAAKLGIGKDNLFDHYQRNIGSIYKNAQDSLNLFGTDRRYNYYTYSDQVDDYGQTYLQLLKSNQWSKRFKTKATLYFTKGLGYYQEFKYQDKLSNYYEKSIIDSAGQVVEIADITRQRWLDNNLYGANFDLVYDITQNIEWSSGIYANHYIGNHFGKVINLGGPIFINYVDDEYYRNKGIKTDLSLYTRGIFKRNKWEVNGDLQLRYIDYSIDGKDNDKRSLGIQSNFLFFNPKIGLSYFINKKQQAYASVAVANKEPIRSDFVDQVFQSNPPKAETLYNLEVGHQYRSDKFIVQSNVYLMLYKNQLVLQGKLNDVGAPLRINVPNSHRLGWEGDFNYVASKSLTFGANLTVSNNKIKNFSEVIYDYTNGFEEKYIEHGTTEISFSPKWINSINVVYSPIKPLYLSISHKYVSKQYLDNTSSEDRVLPAFHYQNFMVEYIPTISKLKKIKFALVLNNVLDRKYVSNGYTYSYIYQDLITENFYYPQAGRHVMFNMNIGI